MSDHTTGRWLNADELARAVELLDVICRDSLEAPLSHVEALSADNSLGDYAVSSLFSELQALLRSAADDRQAALAEALRTERATAEASGWGSATANGSIYKQGYCHGLDYALSRLAASGDRA